MKRKAELDLHNWFHRKNRMPMIIRGARQVGKSTLVRLFCEANQLELVEINLELIKLRSINSDYLELKNVILEIELITNKKIHSKSVVFLDEIQETPKLIQFLRYFYEQRPDIAVIAAGSLLEIALLSGEYSFPVGRIEFYHLGPMSFGEFLLACGEDQLLSYLEKFEFTPAVHEKAKSFFKKYLYIGGMPKAISHYVTSQSLLDIRSIQEQILLTYKADFPKYNRRIELQRIDRIFTSSAFHLGKKVIYQSYDETSKSRDIKRVIELLIDAKVLIPCFHTEASMCPLESMVDDRIYKLFFLDVGLLNAIHRIDSRMIDEAFESNFATKGILAEQFVAQHLYYFEGPQSLPRLNYYLRDKGSQKGEIDFIIEMDRKIIPIEVKSNQSGQLKSLFYFAQDKKLDFGLILSLAPMEILYTSHKIRGADVTMKLIKIPIYATEFFNAKTWPAFKVDKNRN